MCRIVSKGVGASGERGTDIAAAERLNRRRNGSLGLPGVLGSEGLGLPQNKKDDTTNTEGYEAHALIVERRESQEAGPAHIIIGDGM